MHRKTRTVGMTNSNTIRTSSLFLNAFKRSKSLGSIFLQRSRKNGRPIWIKIVLGYLRSMGFGSFERSHQNNTAPEPIQKQTAITTKYVMMKCIVPVRYLKTLSQITSLKPSISVHQSLPSSGHCHSQRKECLISARPSLIFKP